ncbi:MAG: D-aminoacyl-tRNA deacylase, partial [Candidatus Micrarchaeota archaeon]
LFNDSDLLVFASTHKSGAGVPSLTVHAPGNFTDEALLGGNPSELAMASARASKCGLLFLLRQENRVPGYEAAQEATHHGPTSLKAPVVFAEVGSTEKEWANETAGAKVAECIMHVCANWKKEPLEKAAIGFGGPHYLDKFSGLIKERGWGFTHVASRHTAAKMKPGMAAQAVQKSLEAVDIAVVEKKSFNAQQRKTVLDEISKAGLDAEII